ncbi:MAG: SDR family oxidoreductase [Bacteroidales bacterium]|nr:SDR family oxidoreductase [Bacteroidales bacterium]
MTNSQNLGKLAFNGKSILITGGDTGIGAATSKLAAQRGARIMIASLNEETMKKTSEEINAAGGECKWIKCDISDMTQVQKAVQATVDAYGSLDLAYNNAGIAHGPVKTHEIDDALWHKVIDINITGTYYCCKAEIQQFLKQGNGGTILINGSMAGITGVGRMIPYVSSKHAVAGMAKSLAVEYGAQNIRVNFQGPGATDTGMMEQAIKDVMEFRKSNPNDKMLSKIQGPLNRNQTPEEQAEVACFLLSDASSGMTGATVIVDCGATAY